MLKSLFEKDLIWKLEATSQEEVFDQVSQLLLDKGVVKESYQAALKEREKDFPTGLDMEFLGKDLPNLAIPHTDTGHCLAEKVAVVHLKEPVIFHNMIAPDKEVAVSLLFFIINGSNQSQTSILAHLMDFFTSPGNLEILSACQTEEAIYQFIQEKIN